VDALRRFPPAVTYLETAEQHGTLSLSAPSQMELIIGCRNAAELHRLRIFLERFEIRGLRNARLFTRWFDAMCGGKHVVVVVVADVAASRRHWVVTAYMARQLTEGDREWTKS
jgi:hypothetical protein